MKSGQSLKVPEKVIEEACGHLRESFIGLFSPDVSYTKIAEDFFSEQRVNQQLELFFSEINLVPSGQSILEIGSGFGTLVAVARLQWGLNGYGLEPDDRQFKGTYSLSQRIMELNNIDTNVIKPGFGEAIPFADNFFDMVYSNNVLEHVEDPRLVIEESIRVAKPGGYIQFVFPNYGSFWEGHYGILWLPNLSKKLARYYIRMLGRSTDMLDSLNLISARDVSQILKIVDKKVDVISTGRRIWAQRMRNVDIESWGCMSRLKSWVEAIEKLGITEHIVKMGLRFNWHTPFVLTMRKRNI